MGHEGGERVRVDFRIIWLGLSGGLGTVGEASELGDIILKGLDIRSRHTPYRDRRTELRTRRVDHMRFSPQRIYHVGRNLEEHSGFPDVDSTRDSGS